MRAVTPMAVSLESIASCFEGIIPATICSCSADGTPNVTFLSIVHIVDHCHVGLSYQFFNKTRENIAQNPFVQVVVVSPETMRQYRLDLRYERTETEGAGFDRMNTRLDAVASQTGMSQLFKLRGVDIFEVTDCRPVNSKTSSDALQKTDYLRKIEDFTARLAVCRGLDSIINSSLEGLSSVFGYDHSFIMVPDEEGKRLFTLASRGFGVSGVGSEVWMGEGILGIAAERREIVRTVNFNRDLLYSNAIRSAVERHGEERLLEREIALPGLPGVQSQLVAPLVANDRMFGILCLQSAIAGGFLSDDERVIRILARHMATSIALHARAEITEDSRDALRNQPAAHTSARSTISRYHADDSIFIDDAYLIKGIAGRILWKLLQIHVQTGRTQFANKEIRLDTSLQLPDIKDNLEARLILLRRRLQDRCDFLILTQVARGRFRLDVRRQLNLEDRGQIR